MVKCLPAMWETQVRSLGWEDPLEKEMATQSSILAWRIPWTEEPGRLQSMELRRVGHDSATKQQHYVGAKKAVPFPDNFLCKTKFVRGLDKSGIIFFLPAE